MIEKELFKSGTSNESIRNSLLGFFFFIVVVFFISAQIKIFDISAILLISFFGLISIGSLMTLLWVKEVILTDKRLIINWKFFPKSETYLLNEIKDIKEEKYELDTTVKGSSYEIHSGRQAIITFKMSDFQLRLNSYSISNYYVLINKLKSLTKNMSPDFVGDIDNYAKFEQNLYGKTNKFWVIIAIIFIIGMIYFIIKWKNVG